MNKRRGREDREKEEKEQEEGRVRRRRKGSGRKGRREERRKKTSILCMKMFGEREMRLLISRTDQRLMVFMPLVFLILDV